MKNIIKNILRGIPGHSGTGLLITLIMLGAFAGAQRGDWKASLAGAGIMTLFFAPMYLYGAYDGGKRKNNDQTKRSL